MMLVSAAARDLFCLQMVLNHAEEDKGQSRHLCTNLWHLCNITM